MKLIGGDSGRCEREEFVDAVLLAPSERAVVDVLFEQAGRVTLEHHTPKQTYSLATVIVGDDGAETLPAAAFERLRANADMLDERERVADYMNAAPDKTLALVAAMDLGAPNLPAGGIVEYACPMHPEVRSDRPGRCPKCGMKLLPAQVVGGAPQPSEHSEQPAAEHSHEASGIEWEDDMLEVNRMTTPANTHWKLVDRTTGAEGAAIDWRFRVGDRVKIRLINDMDSDHPMHHPFHVHGAGRFLVLSRDGEVEPNLVWKDTVLVRTGQTVDILLHVTNPGLWMAHCHIAEHHESGMMFNFRVDRSS